MVRAVLLAHAGLPVELLHRWVGRPLAGGGEGWWRGLGVEGAGRGRRVGSGTWDAEGSLVGPHPAESNAMLLAAVACPPQMPPCVELFSLLDR